MLSALARKHGLVIVASTHFLDEAAHTDLVALVEDGRIATSARPRELIRHLPGGGRAVDIEFEDLDEAALARLEALAPALAASLGGEAIHLHGSSARILCRDPARALVGIMPELARSGLAVRSCRLVDPGLEDLLARRS